MYDPRYKVHWPPYVLGVYFGLMGAIFAETVRTPHQLNSLQKVFQFTVLTEFCIQTIICMLHLL